MRWGAALMAMAFAVLSTDAAAEPTLVPVLRAAAGPTFRVEPNTPTQTTFLLDATAGVTSYGHLAERIIINGELGYAFDHRGDDLHLFNLTGGMGLGWRGIGATLQPRFLIGVAGTDLAAGMRTGIVFRGLVDLITLEVAHRFIHHDGRLAHDIQFLLGVNPTAFLSAVSALKEGTLFAD